MATLALPLLLVPGTSGAALTGAQITGRMIWSAVGSYIDNAFIFPALFPPDSAAGPALDDQNFSSAKEGSPMNFTIGPECRCDGQMIWKSRLIEIKDTEGGGGKGGQSGAFVVYKYYCHVAVAICDNQINQVKRIWADGKEIYNVNPDVNITAGQLSTAVGTINTVITYTGEGQVAYYVNYLTITSPAGAVDLAQFVSGKQVICAGFAVADTTNNGTWECASSGTNSDDSTWVKLKRQQPTNIPFAAFASGEAPLATLFQDKPAFSTNQVEDIIFYLGTDTQLPDTLIEAWEGTGNVPGFRGVSYVVFQNLSLQDYGNRIPNFTFLVEADIEITLGGAITKIFDRAEIDRGLYDVSAIEDQNLRGLTLQGVRAPASDIQPMLIAYNIAGQLRAGVLHFVYRPDLPVVTVDPNDLAASFAEEDRGNPFRVVDKIDYELNSDLSVDFADPEKDYQTGTQIYVPANPQKPNPGSLSLPLVLSTDEARIIAERLYWLQYVSRQTVELTLPPKYLTVREGDILSFSGLNVLVQRIDRGQESQFLSIEGTIEDTSIFTRTVDSEVAALAANDDYDPSGNFGYPASLQWTILDIPALREEQLVKPGFYLACANENNSIPFTGASLYESIDGTNYYKVDTIYFAAWRGVIESVPLDTVNAGYWDDASSIVVTVNEGVVLSGCTDRQCLNGTNRACIGNEVIGFVNAELTGTNQYTLSRLLRGLRGTEQFLEHDVGEPFIYLNGPGIHWHDLTVAAIGQQRYYKLIPNGGYVELATEQQIRLVGATLRPFVPGHVTVSRDGSNNATFTFLPRRRGMQVDFMPQIPALYEDADTHTIEFYDGATLVRTKTTAAGVYSISYTAAEQTADGLTPGDAISFSLRRNSTHVYGPSVSVRISKIEEL